MNLLKMRGIQRGTQNCTGYAWVKLKFAAMNLKKLATWKWRKTEKGLGGLFSYHFMPIFCLNRYAVTEYSF